MTRQVRAGLVLAHVVAVLLLAIPLPPPGLRDDRPDPSTEAAIRTWSGALARVGLPRGAVEASIRSITAAQLEVVRGIRTALGPYVDLLGVRQDWLMFGKVPDRTARVEIEVHTPAGWTRWYAPHDPSADGDRGLWEQERLRTLIEQFGHRQAKTSYEKLADWLPSRIVQGVVDPDVDRVRIQMRELRIPPPAELARTGHLIEGKVFWAEERAVAR